MSTPRPATVALIAAVARNGAIGRDNELLWRDPQDMAHFRQVTMGCPVVMGRRTWDSLPARFRPLPGRRNVVVTRNPQWHADGAEAAASLTDALARLAEAPKVFVIGGAQLYALALPLADELVLTEIDADFDGDAHFPRWHRAEFDEVAREPRTAADGTRFAFVTYRRRTAPA
ncbi:dihydrofolate reductase [Calidifontimicrobium sp. SYSU G02091]|uniref:dihydrofolate reductase n=1 Tax=Calidifontimicrobium sp. SYSU G02091 TaxID=2926421 RepID=UPI001F52DA89|nr:dihydrofolate reductase [Calidifontimicrobium sp. SYSU G02091]MCI1192012.1 dihydrofolate reductase [Calidifontimicrobium sp. SYSU G02091]